MLYLFTGIYVSVLLKSDQLVNSNSNPTNPNPRTFMTEPYLSEQQQIALFHAVGRRIASIVTNTRGVRISEQIPEIAAIPLLGAFVSLKRDGELRSCMGTLSDQIPLGDAVEQATIHAAKDDPRFSPIAAAELFELEMEIWLLWGMKRVAARGHDRINAVEIGRHGVQIARGGNRGLLLPGVALEYEMDAQTFWEAVCRKAGLPTDAWLDDRSLLHTFEGRAIRGPLAATENIDKKTANEMIFAAKFNRLGSRAAGPTLLELEEIRNVCMATFRGMVEGVSPASYFPGLFDGNVSGIALTFYLPDRPPLLCSKISVRPDVQFQASLIELLRVLGRNVERFGATIQEIRNAAIDVMVLWDPTIHGNANRNDLSQVDSAYRSLMVSTPRGWVVQFDSNRDAEEILKNCIHFLEIDDPDLGEIISFETVSTTSNIFLTSISKPNLGAESRSAAVAGSFYPAQADPMNKELERMLRGASTKRRSCSAVLIPHAGWRYSGRLAAQTLAQAEIPKRVIILAPKHRGTGIDWAIAPNRIWNLPGRNVESDIAFAESMIHAVELFDFDAAAHEQEHSIEVQLPILAKLAPETRIVGLIMAISSWEMIRQGAAQFADFLKMLPPSEMPLLIISSDMNHYANEATTRRVDRVALSAIQEAVKKSKPEHALEVVHENQISMCGIVPTVFAMETLRHLGKLNRVEEVGYTTSAESSGDTSRVVGYAGLLFLNNR
ncbi:MAG: AmmeMemoRadiSam system protein B [Planctomycetaceae bacterium]|jgi:AmmeMemoRadiSam system protein B/AmmeMemoRadiSam system protein A|nr:AmmeMemoRadiSam system protein B [Planctomycetaceae bacterium]